MKKGVICLFLAFCISLNAQNTPQDFLEAHNQARAQKGIGPMTWDVKVAAYADNYAKKRKDCQLIHSEGEYGENIAFSSDPGFSAIDAVKMWMSEDKDYNYESNTCFLGEYECFHYTQVLWKNSTCLGCGRVTCNNGGVFIICNYNPPGNYDGQRPY